MAFFELLESEAAARGAVYGGASGAVVGGISGAEADKRVAEQERAEYERRVAEVLEVETPEAVAAEVDRQVILDYCLHPTNLYAYRRLHGAQAPLPEDLNFEDGDCSEQAFTARIDALPAALGPANRREYMVMLEDEPDDSIKRAIADLLARSPAPSPVEE